MKNRLYWTIPIVSLIILTWLWYPTTSPEDLVLQRVQIDSTQAPVTEEWYSLNDTIVVYQTVEVPVYTSHPAPKASAFDWTREIMTFVLGLGNIVILLRRKNAANQHTSY